MVAQLLAHTTDASAAASNPGTGGGVMSELSAWKVVWIVLAVVGAIAILGGLGMLAMHRCMTGSWACCQQASRKFGWVGPGSTSAVDGLLGSRAIEGQPA